MNIKRYTTLVFLCSILSCSTSHEELKGHWHSVNEHDLTFYNTLDIKDSLAIIDANALVGLYNYEVPLFDKDKSLKLPVLLDDYYPERTTNFQLKNDTLYIHFNKVKYVRSNLNNCLINDYFSDQRIDLRLKNCNSEEAISYHDLREKYLLSHINVGSPKKEHRHKEQFSTVIQVNDVFIEPFHLQKYVNQEKDIFDTHKKNVFCLNLDKHASQTLVDSIYINLDKVLTAKYIFISCIDEGTNKIMYEKYR